jgi:SAM-dependent methyltransferase
MPLNDPIADSTACNGHIERATVRLPRGRRLPHTVFADSDTASRCRRLGSTMRTFVSSAVLSFLTVAAVPNQAGFAQKANLTEGETKMFAASAGYERFMGRWSRLLAPAYIAFAGVKNGDRVLDVGTGTGSLAVALETRMPASEIVGVDPSEGFIDYAKTSAKSARVHFEVGDAQALKFKDASFDNTLALLVMNFVPDHKKAIAEMRRVTRAQGIVSACVWDYNSGMQMLRFFWDEAIALDPAVEPKDERHMKLSREGELGDLWRSAGLINVKEEPLVIDQAYSSFNDYWEPFTKGAGPGGAYVVSLSEDRRQELEARMRKRLLGNRQDGAFTLRTKAWCVRGEVPKP